MAATTMDRQRFIEWLRSEFPRLLQEDPRFSAEVVGILSQTLGSRTEFNRLLEEIRSLREDADRRFEAMDRRFEAVDRRFEAMDRRFQELREDTDRRFEEANRRFEAIERTLAEHGEVLKEHTQTLREHTEILKEHSRILLEHSAILQQHTTLLLDHGRRLRSLQIGIGSLGRRLGRGMEEAVRTTIEEFSGVGPLQAERLVLTDAAGEVFGVPGQAIEFDSFVHDGHRFLVEVKSHAEPEDVLKFFRKLQFAERQIREPFERIMVAPFADERAVELGRELGIRMLTLTEEEPGE
ncbi:MAG: DUF3782 domain-containing protein [Bacillota bacterium]